MTNPNTKALSDAGVSIWLDDLSRDLLETGKISDLIEERNVVGLTSNPSIFQAAMSKGDRYNDDLAKLTKDGNDVEHVVFELTTADVREACDLFMPLYESSNGVDGRASIEVDPRLAHDTDKTVEQAKQMFAAVDRPNVLIKIPATKAGLPAITATIAEGISVNVTLIFSLERYRA
ncbi:MAG: transaldolase, partial [Dermatophilaceae bacterium]|nr:transaldolase [Dermatophilaceae bacterium]